MTHTDTVNGELNKLLHLLSKSDINIVSAPVWKCVFCPLYCNSVDSFVWPVRRERKRESKRANGLMVLACKCACHRCMVTQCESIIIIFFFIFSTVSDCVCLFTFHYLGRRGETFPGRPLATALRSIRSSRTNGQRTKWHCRWAQCAQQKKKSVSKWSSESAAFLLPSQVVSSQIEVSTCECVTVCVCVSWPFDNSAEECGVELSVSIGVQSGGQPVRADRCKWRRCWLEQQWLQLRAQISRRDERARDNESSEEDAAAAAASEDDAQSSKR